MLQWLEKWYESYCDGDWEHDYGIIIKTLDSPGWRVQIDLTDTVEYIDPFPDVDVRNGDDDWMACCIKDEIFIGQGDLSKLEAILTIFKDWVDSQPSNDGIIFLAHTW